MSRSTARSQRLHAQQDNGFLDSLCDRISKGNLTPIISNSLMIDPIFDPDGDGLLLNDAADWEAARGRLSIDEQLARLFAEYLEYPMPEIGKLAQVALFGRVNSIDEVAAKTEYLRWLKDELLYEADHDPAVPKPVTETLKEDKTSRDQPLSQLARKLGYPRPTGAPDTLNLLARLRLPLYVTTSYFDFLERALLATGVTPRTQVCLWNDNLQKLPAAQKWADDNLVLSAEQPVVFHLFGYEELPESLVLTEDDYLDFLLNLSTDNGQRRQIVPVNLRSALGSSSLLLLGYRPGDWDFRVMLRGLIKTVSHMERFNLAIQFDPAQRDNSTSANQIRAYLESYFNLNSQFRVAWDSDHNFVTSLYKTWDGRRG